MPLIIQTKFIIFETDFSPRFRQSHSRIFVNRTFIIVTEAAGGGGGGGGGIGYQVSDITSTKCSFGYFSLDTPTPFAVLTVFLDNT